MSCKRINRIQTLLTKNKIKLAVVENTDHQIRKFIEFAVILQTQFLN